MQRDIINGKPSELESQTGTIVRYGKESNVSTPINTFTVSYTHLTLPTMELV